MEDKRRHGAGDGPVSRRTEVLCARSARREIEGMKKALATVQASGRREEHETKAQDRLHPVGTGAVFASSHRV